MKPADVAVIGGGPGGMAAAIAAKSRAKRVLILEQDLTWAVYYHSVFMSDLEPLF